MEIDGKQLQIKMGRYATGPSTALPNPQWLGMAQNYRRTASARMIALDKEGMERRMPRQSYHVSRKIDGEFTMLIVDGGEVASVNPGGTVRVGLPFMEEALALLQAAGHDETTLLAGELCVDRDDGQRPRVHDVSRVTRKPQSPAQLQQVKLALFDVVMWDGCETSPSYEETWRRLSSVFGEGKLIHPVETVQLGKAEEILKQFEAWAEDEGAEGLVARSDTAGIFKVKPRYTIDAVAIGFTEGIDDRVGLLHDVLLALVRRDGAFHVLGHVGGGFTDDQRRDLLSDLRDLAVESDYTEANSERVAYQMMRPDKVVEIFCLDVISQTTRSGPINRMVIRWSESEDKWLTGRRLPLASLISPEFVRFREDKSPSPEEAGLGQLTDIAEVEATEKTLEHLRLPKSEVLRRVVYTKELKGNILVRKLLMWQRNKEQQSEIHPAYVLHYTDYSLNRRTPLNRKIRVSQSRDQIEVFWREFSQNAFVKGWKEVGG